MFSITAVVDTHHDEISEARRVFGRADWSIPVKSDWLSTWFRTSNWWLVLRWAWDRRRRSFCQALGSWQFRTATSAFSASVHHRRRTAFISSHHCWKYCGFKWISPRVSKFLGIMSTSLGNMNGRNMFKNFKYCICKFEVFLGSLISRPRFRSAQSLNHLVSWQVRISMWFLGRLAFRRSIEKLAIWAHITSRVDRMDCPFLFYQSSSSSVLCYVFVFFCSPS